MDWRLSHLKFSFGKCLHVHSWFVFSNIILDGIDALFSRYMRWTLTTFGTISSCCILPSWAWSTNMFLWNWTFLCIFDLLWFQSKSEFSLKSFYLFLKIHYQNMFQISSFAKYLPITPKETSHIISPFLMLRYHAIYVLPRDSLLPMKPIA